MIQNSTRRLKTHALFAALFGLVGLFPGCGSNLFSGNSTGSMSVKLVDAPITGYKEINLHILKVQIAQATTDSAEWITLGTPDRTVNLLTLTNGVSETLVPDATLAAGHYGQMRLILGDGNTVKLADDTVHDLTVPSGLQSGVKLTVSFDIAAGTTADVFIDFDAANSIRLHQTGQSNKYILRPTVRAYNKTLTGSIAGKLTAADTSAALAGAIVTAQTVDSSGNASIVRSVTTDSTGAYVLDLLPLGGTYYAVSQPVISGTAYQARAGEAITITEQAPTSTWNAAFSPAAATGQIAATVTPPAGDTDTDIVNLTQSLTVGTAAQSFIVRSIVPTIDNSVETCTLTLIPSGSYTLQAARTTTSNGVTTYLRSLATAPTVTANTTTTADLQF